MISFDDVYRKSPKVSEATRFLDGSCLTQDLFGLAQQHPLPAFAMVSVVIACGLLFSILLLRNIRQALSWYRFGIIYSNFSYVWLFLFSRAYRESRKRDRQKARDRAAQEALYRAKREQEHLREQAERNLQQICPKCKKHTFDVMAFRDLGSFHTGRCKACGLEVEYNGRGDCKECGSRMSLFFGGWVESDPSAHCHACGRHWDNYAR